MKKTGAEAYRYGFNGKENSAEISDNSTTAEFWQYDSRIARRFNVDPRPNVSISVYSCFSNNPIWFSDVRGDSIGPNRTQAWNVYVVPYNRDFTTHLDFARFKLTASYTKDAKTLIVAEDKLNSNTAKIITDKLGKNGYINTLAIDYHRSNYAKFDEKDVTNFYTDLDKGYSGRGTNVLLGMCWSGGLKFPDANDKDNLLDLTENIARKMKGALVYGLKTQASALSFRWGGNFGTLLPESYYGNGKYEVHDRKFENNWTISYYNTELKLFTQQDVYKNISLNIYGNLNITPGTKTYTIPLIPKFYTPTPFFW